tara:strand:+ start:1071 stop:1427 length:357 start_codon:yes stop_codon:yes gene_type:complete
VKGGRLTQVSIARNFSKNFFDDYKTPETSALNVRADSVRQHNSQSFYQYLLPTNLMLSNTSQYGIDSNRITGFNGQVSLNHRLYKYNSPNLIKHVLPRLAETHASFFDVTKPFNHEHL